MYIYFLKPLKIIFGVYILTAIGIAADVAQLTNFNLLDFLEKNSPQSYYLIVAVTLVLYLLLVIIEFIRKKPAHQSLTTDHKTGQFITTRNVKNSTFIQINKDKEDKGL